MTAPLLKHLDHVDKLRAGWAVLHLEPADLLDVVIALDAETPAASMARHAVLHAAGVCDRTSCPRCDDDDERRRRGYAIRFDAPDEVQS
jgi:hypothetical protein